MLITSCIALMGVFLANVFSSTQDMNFTVYDRAKEWREFENTKCRENLCAVYVNNKFAV